MDGRKAAIALAVAAGAAAAIYVAVKSATRAAPEGSELAPGPRPTAATRAASAGGEPIDVEKELEAFERGLVAARVAPSPRQALVARQAEVAALPPVNWDALTTELNRMRAWRWQVLKDTAMIAREEARQKNVQRAREGVLYSEAYAESAQFALDWAQERWRETLQMQADTERRLALTKAMVEQVTKDTSTLQVASRASRGAGSRVAVAGEVWGLPPNPPTGLRGEVVSRGSRSKKAEDFVAPTVRLTWSEPASDGTPSLTQAFRVYINGLPDVAKDGTPRLVEPGEGGSIEGMYQWTGPAPVSGFQDVPGRNSFSVSALRVYFREPTAEEKKGDPKLEEVPVFIEGPVSASIIVEVPEPPYVEKKPAAKKTGDLKKVDGAAASAATKAAKAL
eukprot:tig00000249_g22152.t1